jgi:hypothetical protein
MRFWETWTLSLRKDASAKFELRLLASSHGPGFMEFLTFDMVAGHVVQRCLAHSGGNEKIACSDKESALRLLTSYVETPLSMFALLIFSSIPVLPHE